MALVLKSSKYLMMIYTNLTYMLSEKREGENTSQLVLGSQNNLNIKTSQGQYKKNNSEYLLWMKKIPNFQQIKCSHIFQ